MARDRHKLGNGTFGHLITQTGSDPELTSMLGSLLDQVDTAENPEAAQGPQDTDITH